jgi:hypothetical protein
VATAIRGLFVCFGLGAALASSLPGRREVPELVSLLTETPFHFDEDSWALEQARQRPEVLPEVERRLADTSTERLAHQQLVLVELHARLGGPPAVREPVCRSLAERKHLDPDTAARARAPCAWSEAR